LQPKWRSSIGISVLRLFSGTKSRQNEKNIRKNNNIISQYSLLQEKKIAKSRKIIFLKTF
jgi:hypothetical protein